MSRSMFSVDSFFFVFFSYRLIQYCYEEIGGEKEREREMGQSWLTECVSLYIHTENKKVPPPLPLPPSSFPLL